MRISDWSSDVCSSDLIERDRQVRVGNGRTLNFLGNLRTNSGLALLHQCSFLRLHSGAALQQRPSDAKDQHESKQQRRQVPRERGNPASLIPFIAKSYRIGSEEFAGRKRHEDAASRNKDNSALEKQHKRRNTTRAAGLTSVRSKRTHH